MSETASSTNNQGLTNQWTFAKRVWRPSRPRPWSGLLVIPPFSASVTPPSVGEHQACRTTSAVRRGSQKERFTPPCTFTFSPQTHKADASVSGV